MRLVGELREIHDVRTWNLGNTALAPGKSSDRFGVDAVRLIRCVILRRPTVCTSISLKAWNMTSA